MTAEARLQTEMMTWLGVVAPWLIAIHIPNGGSRHIREARKLKDMGVTAGVPDLALLWQVGIGRSCEAHLTVRASQGWRPCEESEYGLSDGWHARLRRRSPDSFFSVPLP